MIDLGGARAREGFWLLITLCATSCIMFPLCICVIYLWDTFMVVRHDIMRHCDIFMSCVWLILLCFYVFYSDVLWAICYILLYTSHIFGCRMVDLVDISMTNHFVFLLSHAYRNQVIWKPHFLHTRGYCHQSPKRGRLKEHLGPNEFRWLMTMLIIVTNVCFAEAKSLVLGHGNRYSMNRDIHAYLIVEIVSIFKGWMDIVKTRLGLSAIWWRSALRVV